MTELGMVLGIIVVLWLTRAELNEPYFPMEDEGIVSHNLWIKPTVQIVKSWKSGGRVWTGPWNYDALARQLPGWNCWYCNVYLGTRHPSNSGQIEDAAEKCTAIGRPCDKSVPCCDFRDPDSITDDPRLCNKVSKTCVPCRPSYGDKCRYLYKRCCQDNPDIFCLPKPGDEGNENAVGGVCKELNCLLREGSVCGAGIKKPCCPSLECKNGQCEDCEHRSCTGYNKGCCPNYYCGEFGSCVCEFINKHCSKSLTCCPPFVCSSSGPKQFNPGENAFDAICVARDNCASGAKPCPENKICVNDVCVYPCIRSGYTCGRAGDPRKCCVGTDRCQLNCKHFCDGHRETYCSSGAVHTSLHCKCPEFSSCVKNKECSGNDGTTCCIHPEGSNCQAGKGSCKAIGRGILRCIYGPDSGITVGYNEANYWISHPPGGKSFVECPH